MQTSGVVVEVTPDYAIVKTERNAACDSCHKNTDGSGCSVCSLMGPNREFLAKAQNSIGANVGDTVELETASNRVLLYSAMVFVFPILLAVIGFIVGALCSDNEVVCVFSAAVGFVLSFLLLKIYSDLRQKKQPDIVITKVLQTKKETT